jgi:hypothetical protein
MAGFSSPLIYLLLIFMPGFAVRAGTGEDRAEINTLIASIPLVLLLVPMGRLCDRVGSRVLILSSSAVGTALVVPLVAVHPGVARVAAAAAMRDVRVLRDVHHQLRADGGESLPGGAARARRAWATTSASSSGAFAPFITTG